MERDARDRDRDRDRDRIGVEEHHKEPECSQRATSREFSPARYHLYCWLTFAFVNCLLITHVDKMQFLNSFVLVAGIDFRRHFQKLFSESVPVNE